MHKLSTAPWVLGALFLGPACDDGDDTPATPQAIEINQLNLMLQVLETNADIALAAYQDSVDTAQALAQAIDTLVDDPSQSHFDEAKSAWLASREPYGQTEVYRFRASPIDDTNYNPDDDEDGPEGSINAWPLGEALIDYVTTGNDFGEGEVSVTEHQTGVMPPIPGNNLVNSVDIPLTADLLDNSATAADEHDVIAGYHAIEFLLWGQDLNSDGSADTLNNRDGSAGQRPYTDYLTDAGCTGPDAPNADATLCQRRGQLLKLMAARLVSDLESVRDGWVEGASYREAFTNVDTVDEAKEKFLEILTGMGTLSEGELAGERMQIALSANSQEDEHSCFSDNTHRDIFLNAEGISNSYFGAYAGFDSSGDGVDDNTARAVDGYGFDDYLRALGLDPIAAQVESLLAETLTHTTAIDTLARADVHVDVQIQDFTAANADAMKAAILALNAQSLGIIQIAEALSVGTASQVVDPDASECDTSDPTTACP